MTAGTNDREGDGVVVGRPEEEDEEEAAEEEPEEGVCLCVFLCCVCSTTFLIHACVWRAVQFKQASPKITLNHCSLSHTCRGRRGGRGRRGRGRRRG